MFNPAFFDNSALGGLPILEAKSIGFIPLQKTSLKGQITGNLAKLNLQQIFKNKGNRALDVAYRFPLPGDAAVEKVTINFGERTIVADLQPLAQAEKTFQKAKQKGQQAVLAEKPAPDVFSLLIANLPANAKITITTDYLLLIKPEAGVLTLRQPLTIAPRFSREDEESPQTNKTKPLALYEDTQHRFDFDLEFRGQNAQDLYCEGVVSLQEPTPRGLRVSGSDIIPNRDLIIRYQLPELITYFYQDPDSAERYFVSLITPPPQTKTLKKNSVFLVDTSGSMEGAKEKAAIWTIKKALSSLAPDDQFALCSFSSEQRWFSQKLEKATPAKIKKAQAFIENNLLHGGTQLGVALETALLLFKPSESKEEIANALTIITDGQVSDDARILTLVNQEAQKKNGRRLNVICIDSAPNEPLVTKIATRGRGIVRFLSSDPEERDLTTALTDIIAELSAPVLNGNHFQIEGQAITILGGQPLLNQTKVDLDLGYLAREPKWLFGKSQGAATFQVKLPNQVLTSLLLEGEAEIKQLVGSQVLAVAERWLKYSTSPAKNEEEETNLLREFLPAKCQSLLTPPATVYYENQTKTSHKEQVLQALSEKFHLLSSVMGFVAVDSQTGSKAKEMVAVGNAIPAGWQKGSIQLSALPSIYYLNHGQQLRASGQNSSWHSSEPVYGAINQTPHRHGLMPDLTSLDYSNQLPDFKQNQTKVEKISEQITGQERYELKSHPSLTTLSGIKLLSPLPSEGQFWLLLLVNGAEKVKLDLRDLAVVGERPLNLKLTKTTELKLICLGQPHQKMNFFLEIELIS